jgi:hypothetical protein
MFTVTSAKAELPRASVAAAMAMNFVFMILCLVLGLVLGFCCWVFLQD